MKYLAFVILLNFNSSDYNHFEDSAEILLTQIDSPDQLDSNNLSDLLGIKVKVPDVEKTVLPAGMAIYVFDIYYKKKICSAQVWTWNEKPFQVKTQLIDLKGFDNPIDIQLEYDHYVVEKLSEEFMRIGGFEWELGLRILQYSTVGHLVGGNAETPPVGIRLQQALQSNDHDLLLKWSNSFSPVELAYAAIGLHIMESDELEKVLKKCEGLVFPVFYRSGCTIHDELSLASFVHSEEYQYLIDSYSEYYNN